MNLDNDLPSGFDRDAFDKLADAGQAPGQAEAAAAEAAVLAADHAKLPFRQEPEDPYEITEDDLRPASIADVKELLHDFAIRLSSFDSDKQKFTVSQTSSERVEGDRYVGENRIKSTVAIPESLHRRIVALRADRRSSIQELAIEALEDLVTKHGY